MWKKWKKCMHGVVDGKEKLTMRLLLLRKIKILL
jgi:hypothetical protein